MKNYTKMKITKAMMALAILFGFTTPAMAEDYIYELTSSMSSGDKILIVSINSTGNGYALGHSGSSVASDAVTVKRDDNIADNYYIEDGFDNTSIWTVEVVDVTHKKCTFKNGDYYVAVNGVGGLAISKSSDIWKWKPEANQLYYPGTWLHYLCYDGILYDHFETSTNEHSIYLYKKVRKKAKLTVTPQELEMEARPNSQVTANFTVSGQYIYDSGVDLSVNNSAFTISPTHLTKAQAEAGTTITVTYKPTANQDYTGKVTISTQGATDKEVTLNGYSTGYLVTIGSAGATTLYVDMPLIVPSNEIYPGLQVFYASGITDKEGGKKELNLTSLNNNIPANTGVVILGPEGTYYFLKYRGSAPSPISGNLLSGTTTGTTRKAVLSNAQAGSIVMTLSKLNGQLGFYKYVNDNLAANKAYLIYKPAAGSNVTYFSFGDESGEETDDISNMKIVGAADSWYTLQGARLNGQPTQRGIYIHGGKKVIVK